MDKLFTDNVLEESKSNMNNLEKKLQQIEFNLERNGKILRAPPNANFLQKSICYFKKIMTLYKNQEYQKTKREYKLEKNLYHQYNLENLKAQKFSNDTFL